MPAVSLERAKPEDAPDLADLRVLAMRPSLEAVGRFDPERARGRFLASFVAQDTWHIVSNGARAGVLVLRAECGELLLDHLYIHPDHQGRTLGAAALDFVFTKALELGRVVRVGALRGSRSNEFYVRHGFKLLREAEWDNYYVWAPRSVA